MRQIHPVDLVVANDVTFRGMGTEDNEIYIVNSQVERHQGDKDSSLRRS